MAELEFHGAAQEVTGSFHVLHVDDGPVALDCGLFQGKRGQSRQKNLDFPLPPSKLKAVLLSHAHMDHSGNIPGLVRNGFSGPIYATPATCDLCDVMLADSAKIQEEDARFWNEKRATGPDDYIEPLYTAEDARASHKYFHGVNYDTPFNFAQGCSARLLEAGHILGSASMLIEIANPKPVRILYTGDLGRFRQPILRDPASPLPQVDYLITECTYANRRHDEAANMKERLVWIINQTRLAGGKVIIPAFSVGRTQMIVYFLAQAIAEGLLDPLPIYVDSPLSFNATEVFKKHPECYDEETSEFLHSNGDPFGFGSTHYTASVEESKRLNERKESCVIIASSGMCEAGRILHHLKNNVENEANTVIIVGFQAQHTLGRRIVERREEIKIYGRMYKLLCRVETLNGFSAHADMDDFTRSFAPIAKNLKAAFAVHGEGAQPLAMQDILHKLGCQNVHIPAPGERFTLE
ncbi:MAG: MBL fold metallo-hydrolase [Planctomycetaceae bacterium]|nr:MAG: MBL fold metallo-hydrolase [Planctomycetaceae bacterium]